MIDRAQAQGHCEDFRRTTYPGITAIASDVYDYAQIACGKGTNPYFSYCTSSVQNLHSVMLILCGKPT